HPRLDYRIVGLVSEHPSATGLTIHNATIVGCYEQLEAIIQSRSPDEIFLVATAIPDIRRRDLMQTCRRAGRAVKLVPDLGAMLTGKPCASRLPAPETDDLLFREPVRFDPKPVRERFRDQRVMVTGAGGSIGSELCRQIAA